MHTDNYKLPYASKTGVDERNYQLILAEAFRTMKHDGPMLMAPRSRIRGRAWQYYKGGR